MAYSDFTLESACRAFALALDHRVDLHAEVEEIAVGEQIRSILEENVTLATSIHTEKARSELIVAPILVEVRKLTDRRISLFSGIDFTVDPAKGLNGTCDFILSDSPNQLFLEAPIVMIVEAKNDNIKSGLGQCIAEMVAARLFNESRRGGPTTTTIQGAVTTGTLWQFLTLDGPTVFVDRTEYYLDRLEKILAILLHCVRRPVSAGAPGL